MATVERDLKRVGGRYYFEEIYLNNSKAGYRPHAAFSWAGGIHLSAINAAALLGDEHSKALIGPYVRMLNDYWVDQAGFGGYCDSPHPTKPERYYDDNAWLLLDLLEAHQATGDKDLLAKARATATFILSGEDDKLGGGLYWFEAKKESKNTCANAPAVVGLAKLFKATGEQSYLTAAKRLHAWTRKNLQDSDGLYFDHLKLDGSVNKVKYTYNTALMIRAACELFDITRDESFLREAERVAESAKGKWCRENGAIADNSYFAHLLGEAFLELGERNADAAWIETAQRAAEFVWSKNHDNQGRYPERWDVEVKGQVDHVTLKNQSSAARAYFRLALHYQNAK